MTIPNLLRPQNKFARLAVGWRRAALASLGLISLTGRAQTWTTLDLPDLGGPALAISHLSDGQFIYGNNNTLYLQNTFGSASLTTFATPPGVDPSFVTVLNDTTAIAGAGGGFAPSPVYQFNPSNPASPGYTAGATLQNYAAAPASSSSAYVVGLNGSGTNEFDLNDSAVSYVTLDGQQQVLVDNAGGFSAGVAVDGAGDLFVGDDDDNSVYEFTAAQVLNAVAHATVLQFSNGALVHTFAADVVGSLAVDALGRVWATGYGEPGIFWFDPATDASGMFDPEDAADDPDGAYTLSTFSANGNDYVSYVWQSNFAAGGAVVYGYDLVQNVPEPATAAWFAALAAGLAVAWQRRRKANLA